MTVGVKPIVKQPPLEELAKQRYVDGKCEVEELEADLELIFSGGEPDWAYLDRSPFPAFETEILLR